MTQSWEHFVDPDTQQGIAQYKKAGISLHTPSDLKHLSSNELRCFARRCSELLDSTYKGNYPQSAKDVEALAASMARGDTLMFLLQQGERVIATAGIMRRGNSLHGNLGFAELSKAAKLPHKDASSVSVRHLMKYRLLWAKDNLPDVDFLYCSPRAASEGKDGTPGGKQAQSIWWGGRRHGISLPLVTTNAGWNFRLGGIEPLTGFVVPANASKWANAVSNYTVYVPDEASRYVLRTLFAESTNGHVVPKVETAMFHARGGEFTFREARQPSVDIVTKYYITKHGEHLVERTVDEAASQLRATISQKAIIESDIATTTEGAQIMHELLHSGWTLTGWQPSEIVYGGICPVLARVNPLEAHELIEPMHYPQYFDESGYGRTRQVLDNVYQAMRNAASL
jgi:hypothetical protein